VPARRKKTASRRTGATPRRTPRRSGARKLPNWSLLVLGLAIGIVVVMLVQWVVQRAQTPGTGLHNVLVRKPDTAPATPTKPPAPSNNIKTSYDFYTILPESEAVIPDREWSDLARQQQQGVQYMLQAASYNNYADADRLKARLAFSGVVSEIQKVTVGNKGTFYRVRLGPFDRAIDADDASRKLAELGIKPLVLKLKTPAKR
jgi:cell division protein FtsN